MEKVHIQKLNGAKPILVGIYILICFSSLTLSKTNGSWLPFIGTVVGIGILLGYCFYRVTVFEKTGISVSKPITGQELISFYKKLLGNLWAFAGCILLSSALAIITVVIGSAF